MADQVCTTAAVKLQLTIDPSDTTDDVYISALIDGVTDWMQDYTRRLLVPHVSATYLLDTARGYEIDVRRLGVRAVTALAIATTHQPDTGGSYTAVAGSEIVLRPPELDRDPGMPATSILLLSTALYDAVNGAQLTATTGPAVTPDRIARVGIDAVAAAYQARKAGGSGVIGSDDSATVDWSKYFAWGSPQRQTLRRLRGGIGIA